MTMSNAMKVATTFLRRGHERKLLQWHWNFHFECGLSSITNYKFDTST